MPPPSVIDSAERGWNIINPKSASVTEPHGQLPDKNDERASACPSLNGRRDRTKRSTPPGSGVSVPAFTRMPRTNVAPSLGRFAVEILAISLQSGYFCARDVDARTRVCLCACIRMSHHPRCTRNSGMPGRVEHLSCRTGWRRIDALYRARKAATARGSGKGGREREIIYG